ncbi:MAG: bleomycin resistance protein [Chitinophagales bacterium]|nr:MAG: bleomycin resistance protein [Chitinophagales bacterium]
MKLKFTKIKETCLYIRDIDRTRAFYSGKLGLEVIGVAPGRHIFFRVGESVLLCFVAEITSRESTLPAHEGSGRLHFAFETKPHNYEAWKKKLQSEGIVIEHEATWKNGLRSFYFRDPDGHLAEIAQEGIWD